MAIQNLLFVATEKLSVKHANRKLAGGLFARATINISVSAYAAIGLSVIYYKYTSYYLIW